MKRNNDLSTPVLRPITGSRSGAALIIILAFMVMMLVLLMAFFSQSTLQQQVSKSSAGLATADVFARGAAASIIGDLKQEIIAGSTITTNVGNTVTPYIYAPYTYSGGVVTTVTAMPAISGFTMTNGLENLLKISAGNTNFFPSNSTTYPNISSYPPANRASTNLTTAPSRNGRSISQIRWNQPLLIARQNPTSTTDLTPTNTFTNAIPQWIYVSRNGANPTTWSTNLTWSTTNASTVIGRYAYAIYHEGGLLDANVAGYPPSLTNYSGTPSLTNLPGPYVPYKQGTFFADLTQIGLTPTQITNLVGWRNYISGNVSGSYPSYSFSGSGTNYATNVLASTNGFLQTYNNGTSSDRQFTSRQQLIAFLKSADSSGVTNALNSLRYLATFTRSLEQPSLIPPTNRPTIVNNLPGTSSKGWNGNGWDPSVYQGGNDNYGNDTNVNPNFLTICVSNSFTRYDGSTAVVGEPLVKRRFDLRQLCWLTYQGPTATLTVGSNPDLQQLTNCGISTNYLALGTATNVGKAFGLTWDSSNGFWTYTATNTTANTNVIRTLSQVAALSPAREPNFFELLKASINAGSIGKSSASGTNGGALYQHQLDITSDYQILQIGANLMDQNDCDGYPTRIQCKFGGGMGLTEIRGVENLPSLYRLTYSYVVQSTNSPMLIDISLAPTNPTIDFYGNPIINRGFSQTNWSGGTANGITNSNPSLNPGLNFNPGTNAYYANPNLWNIHDQNDIAQRGANYALGNPRPSNSALAVTITYAPPITPSGINSSPLNTNTTIKQWIPGCYFLFSGRYMNATVNNAIAGTNAEQPIKYYFGTNAIGAPLNSTNFALVFGDNNGTLYREPTILWRSNVPSGSGLTWFSTDITARDRFDNTDHLGFPFATNMASMYLSPTNIITGPVASRKTNYAILQALQLTTIGSWNGVSVATFPDATNGIKGSATIACQFSNSYGWQTYDEKYWDNIDQQNYIWNINRWTTNYYQYPSSTNNNGPFAHATRGIDPRSGRFSTGVVWGPNTNFLETNILANANNCAFGTTLITNSANLKANYYGGTNVGIDAATLATAMRDTNFLVGSATTASANKNWNIMFQDSAAYSFTGNNPAVLDCWAMNSPWFTPTISIGTNPAATYTTYKQFNADPDGVVRRAMGAYVPITAGRVTASTNPIGVATITATTGTPGSFTNAAPQQSQSRPIVLNRPFRTVDEMGYTFRGSPYKNLDFFLPESGDAGLLDTFCVGPNSTSGTNAFSSFPILSEGKVNLNTLQTPVLAALVSGALSDEFNKTNSLLSNDVAAITAALTNRTAGTNPWQGPLANVGDLAGRFIGINVSGVTPNTPNQTNYYSSMLCSPGVGYANLTTTVTYAGLSADLGSMTNTTNSAILIQRLRQAGLRPFVTQGQTRVWNLMIDLVAQTGRFAPAASNLDQFVVEGESHFWLHVAIDRYTGQILDSQLEPVTE